MIGTKKILRYIERTGVKFPAAYDMNMGELESLRGMGTFEALALAFEYGRAKGFRYSRKVEKHDTREHD